MLTRVGVLVSVLALTTCQSTGSRIIVDTTDGQALPQAVISGGASQTTIARSITEQSGQPTKIDFVAYTNPDCSNAGFATVR